jgi:hypothetical protein
MILVPGFEKFIIQFCLELATPIVFVIPRSVISNENHSMSVFIYRQNIKQRTKLSSTRAAFNFDFIDCFLTISACKPLPSRQTANLVVRVLPLAGIHNLLNTSLDNSIDSASNEHEITAIVPLISPFSLTPTNHLLFLRSLFTIW